MPVFKTAKGVALPQPPEKCGVKQSYEVGKFETPEGTVTSFAINISAENIAPFIGEICKVMKAPLFLILEIPCCEEDESKLRKKEDDPFHYDVCFLDDCPLSQIQSVFKKYGDIFINDGFLNFGIGSHETGDELFFDCYKLCHIYSDNPKPYYQVMEKFGIPKVNKLKTVWDTFNMDNTGVRTEYRKNGMGIYEVADELIEQGLYVAEVKEE